MEGIKVTKANLAMVYGHIKNALKGKSYMAARNVYTNSLKRAKSLLLSHSTWHYVHENGITVMSVKTGKDFYPKNITIDDSEGNKYIAVRNAYNGSGSIINVGDTVKISILGIFVRKTESSTFPSHIEVWQF